MKIDTETKLCISISARPGGFGNKFHNYLYERMGLNFIYKGIACSDLAGAIRAVRALGIVGCGVSMPFKIDVIPLLDEMDEAARTIGAVNTVVNQSGRLKGYNTDYSGVLESLAKAGVSKSAKAALMGSGGVARAAAKAICDYGIRDCTIVARNAAEGKALASKHDFKWLAPESAKAGFEFILNATPVGMGSEDLSVPMDWVHAAVSIGDCVAVPPTTALLRAGEKLGKPLVRGTDIVAFQAREQFKLYTGIVPPQDLLDQAVQFSRS